MELHFDILDDLSEDLDDLDDYFRFLMINDLTIELKSIVRIVEYYHMTPPSLKGIRSKGVYDSMLMIRHIIIDHALDVIKWLKRHNKPEIDYLTMTGTCHWGNYEMARWCHDNKIRSCYRRVGDKFMCDIEGFPNKCRNSERGFEITCALNGDNLETLKFLHDNNYIKPDDFLLRIIRKCNLEIFKWAIENMDARSKNLSDMIISAISWDRLDIVEWFYDHVEIPEISVDIIHSNKMLKWLRDKGVKLTFDDESMDHACRRGNLEIIKWLIDNGAQLNLNSFILIMEGDNIEAIEFVHSHYWLRKLNQLEYIRPLRVNGSISPLVFNRSSSPFEYALCYLIHVSRSITIAIMN